MHKTQETHTRDTRAACFWRLSPLGKVFLGRSIRGDVGGWHVDRTEATLHLTCSGSWAARSLVRLLGPMPAACGKRTDVRIVCQPGRAGLQKSQRERAWRHLSTASSKGVPFTTWPVSKMAERTQTTVRPGTRCSPSTALHFTVTPSLSTPVTCSPARCALVCDMDGALRMSLNSCSVNRTTILDHTGPHAGPYVYDSKRTT